MKQMRIKSMKNFKEFLNEAIKGQCKNCGSDRHPKGNFFKIQKTDMFELENKRNHPLPKTEYTKVCNNCDYPHPFTRRMSAKNKSKEALFQRLIKQSDEK
jgi:hypothetical protein